MSSVNTLSVSYRTTKRLIPMLELELEQVIWLHDEANGEWMKGRLSDVAKRLRDTITALQSLKAGL